MSESSDRAFSATETKNAHALIKLDVAGPADVKTLDGHMSFDDVQPFGYVANIGRAVFCSGGDYALSGDGTDGRRRPRALVFDRPCGSSTAAAGGRLMQTARTVPPSTRSISCTTRLRLPLYNYCMDFLF